MKKLFLFIALGLSSTAGARGLNCRELLRTHNAVDFRTNFKFLSEMGGLVGDLRRSVEWVFEDVKTYLRISDSSRLTDARYSGLVNGLLRNYLLTCGYEVRQFITKGLNGDYLTPDHTVLVVMIEGVEVIVDATYFQFLRIYGIQYGIGPDGSEDDPFMAVPYALLPTWVSRVENLGAQNYARLPRDTDPQLSEVAKYVAWSPEKRREYLTAAWDFKAGHYQEGDRIVDPRSLPVGSFQTIPLDLSGPAH